MRRHRAARISSVIALLLVGCGDGPVAPTQELAVATDITVDSAIPDVPAAEVKHDATSEIATVDGAEADASVSDACQSDDDCPDGACIYTPQGSLCTFPCDDENACPPTHYCQDGEPPMCVPIHASLCHPCLNDFGCDATSGARCAQFADKGTFCVTTCGVGCPAGYSCEAVTLLDSTTTERCVPSDGSLCECTEPAIAANLPSGCYFSNEHGTCHGYRMCTEEGLGDCEAPVPTAETCGGGDENCNGPIDEAGAEGCLMFYQDVDQDGLGDEADGLCYCQPQGLYTALKVGDCDDSDPDVGACVTYFADLDADGWGDGEDSQCLCEPEAPYTATESGCKQADDTITACEVYYLDEDKDGVGSDENKCLCAQEGAYSAPEGGDCDDQDPNVDICWEHFYDADADGVGDKNLSECLCGPLGLYTAPIGGDCDDEEPLSTPGKVEICDAVDNDCNGLTDEENATGCVLYLYDGDQDSFGVAAQSKCLCQSFGKYTATQGGDCNDLDPAIYPGQPCSPPVCEGFIISGVCPDGTCGEGSEATVCPGGFVCLDSNSCRDGCASKDHCAPGNYCVAGSCIPEGPDGSPCSDDDECASDHCGNGYCCGWGACCSGLDADCDIGNPCQDSICDAAFQCQTTKFNGTTCGEASCQGTVHTAEKYCIEGMCIAGGKKTLCSSDGKCEVATCTLDGCGSEDKDVGASCGEFMCSGFELVQPKTCDAFGSCNQGGATEVCPNSFACLDAGQCRKTCLQDNQCQPDTYCDGGSCDPLKEDGLGCIADSQCFSQSCQGGFCCNGCCDGGTLGTDQFSRAVEICGESYFAVEGNPLCRRIIAEFGKFKHSDKDPSLKDTAMSQLSTGIAASMANQQAGESTGTSGPDPDGTVGTVYDLCGFTVKLKVPDTAKGMAFDFIFFSAEYPEWVGSQFNDSFNVMLVSTNFDGNVAFDNQGNPISINNVLFNTFGNALAGTGYENGVGGSTGWLTTTVPLIPGETITIRFVIYDEGDHIYDSDVLINNFRWLEFQPGVGPVTE